MAYGKDSGNLDRVVPYGGTLSQRGRSVVQARSGKKESGGRPFWSDILKVPSDHSRIIRIIPGQYKQAVSYDDVNPKTGKPTFTLTALEYVKYIEHRDALTERTGICSAGPQHSSKDHREDCLGCDRFWEDYEYNRGKKPGERRNTMRKTHKFAYTVWDYGLWLKQPRRGNDGKEYYDWVAAPPNDPRMHQMEYQYGRLLPWSIGVTWQDVLLTYNDKNVQNDCPSCGGSNTIYSLARICGNPACQHEVFDTQTTTMTPETQQAIINNPSFTCPACGHIGFVDELIGCAGCDQKGTTPKRASIFDVDLEVSSTGQSGQQTFLLILQRSETRPIQVFDATVLETIKPLDLLRKFAPTPMETQYKIYKTSEENVRVPQQQAPQYQPPQAQAPHHQAPPIIPPRAMPTMGRAPMAMPGQPPQYVAPTAGEAAPPVPLAPPVPGLPTRI